MVTPMAIFVFILILTALTLFGVFATSLFGIVIIREHEVGIVVRKFGARLPAGQLIALKGEAGYQADTLAPGWHFSYFPWKFSVRKVPITTIPQGEIGLVVASDGAAIPSDRILAKSVACHNFQDTREFLLNGGEKGRQLAILTAGKYRINTAVFTIITSNNAADYGINPRLLTVYTVQPDKVGIVTTMDGQPIDEGEIAGPLIEGHNNFQDTQTFLNNHGRRGLQEQVLLSGSWNLNPWFVQVEQVNMTAIPIGHVGHRHRLCG